MTPRHLALVLVVAGLVAAGPAVAGPEIAGTYEVKYEEVANNCNQTGLAFTRGEVKLTVKKGTLTIDIARMPIMSGKVSKGPRLRAQSKLGKTSIQGLDGKFTAAGRVKDGVIQLVVVAEYYLGRRPLCTQSWNASGVRAEDLD